MNLEKNIIDKLNEVSMTPSSDIMSKVRKKRTPFYVFKNHLKLNKGLYVTAAAVIIMAISLPYIIDENKESGLSDQMIVQDKGAQGSEQKTIDLSKNNSINELEDKSNSINDKITKNEAVKEISDDQATDKAGINKNNQWSPSYSKTDSKTVENKGEIEIEVNKNSNLSANDNVVSAANYETEFSGNKDIVNDEVKTNAVFNQPNSRVDLENKKEQLMVLEDINVPQAQLSLLESTFEFESERIDIHGPKEKLFNFGLRNVGIGAGVYKESFAYGNSEMDSRMKASTSSTNATSYGVNLGFQLYKKWMLYTGLELYARNEQFTYQELSNNYILNIDTVKGKVHIPGQPDQEVVRYDSTYVNDGNHQQMSVTNKTSYYEIPLTLSYRMWSNRKLAIALNPGVRVGILNAQKGMTLDAAYKPVTINGEKAVEQYNNVNLNAEIGLDLDYKLYRRANLFLQPKVRQGLGNLMDNKAGFNKSNTSFGIFGGIRYEF